MRDAVRELKIRAEILHHQLKAQSKQAQARLRILPKFRRVSDSVVAEATRSIRRRDCLTVVAAEFGFQNWPQAKLVLSGEAQPRDYGTLLCPPRFGSGHINRWYSRYEDAAAVRESCRGYLLAYRNQYLVVDRYYIEDLGLDPEDSDWDAIGFDWVRPKSVAARVRLYSKLVARLSREAVNDDGRKCDGHQDR